MPQNKALDLSAACDAAVGAASEAALLIRRHAGRLADAAIRDKGRNDLVTEVDEAVERLLIDRLTASFPQVAVLAEESADDRAPAEAAGYRWIIDPIDGTTNFTHGLPPYAVSIALQQGATIVVAVVLEVARDELFTAVRGQGCYRNGARVHVSDAETAADSLVTTGFPYRAFGHLDAYLETLRAVLEQTQGVRRPGAASVDLAYVACGRFEAFYETGLAPWDVAAGLLLVEEAGGRVTDLGGRPNPVFARQILATNGRVHEGMQRLVQPLATAFE